MPQKNKKPTTAEPDYQEFIRGLKLLNVGLNACSCKIDRDRYFNVISSKSGGTSNIAARYHLESARDDYFVSHADFKLSVVASGGQSALTLNCTFDAAFGVREKLHREFAERFTSSEIRLVIWPYFRQFVSDVTARMTIPPITVPLSIESAGD